MKILDIRIEGAYAHKCLRPTVELSNGHQVMLGYGEYPRKLFSNKERTETFTVNSITEAIQLDVDRLNKREGLTMVMPDTDMLVMLHSILFKPEYNTNIIIDIDKKIAIQNQANQKIIDKIITPLCNPKTIAPDCNCIEEICAIAHTPEVKQAYIDSLPVPEPKQKTIKVMKPFSRIEMVDGVPTLKTGEEEVDELVFQEIPVVDESGNPVMQLVSDAVEAVEAVVAVVDEETGDEISPAVEAVEAKDAVYTQITHKVPVME